MTAFSQRVEWIADVRETYSHRRVWSLGRILMADNGVEVACEELHRAGEPGAISRRAPSSRHGSHGPTPCYTNDWYPPGYE